jgi:hypothetical protein
MSYGLYMGCCLLGLAAAMAIFVPLGPKRRAWIPPLAWWLLLILGAVTCWYGMSHSTAPSFASRVTAVGKIYEFGERGRGRDRYFGFRFVPEIGDTIDMQTEMVFPHWGNPSIQRTFRVVYLQSSDRFLRNEAIDIEILSGKDAGFHESLDARPAGRWLAIPIGATLGIFGFAGLRYMKDDADSAASSDDDDASSN